MIKYNPFEWPNCGAPERQCAVLIIKWEVGDLDGTGAAIDGRRQPVHPAVVVDQHVGIVGHIKLSINAAEKRVFYIKKKR